MRLSKKPKLEADARHAAANQLRADRYRYHSSRQDVEQYNRGRSEPKREDRQLLARLPTVVAVITVAASAIYLLWLDTVPRIKTEIEGPSLLQDESAYVSGVSEVLNQSWLNHSKLTLNTKDVANQIEKKFPEVAEAVVIIPLASHKPVIALRPKQPTLLLRTQNGAYIIDKKGEVLMPASQLDNVASFNLTSATDHSGLEVQPGTRAVSTDTVTFISQLQYQFAEAGRAVGLIALAAAPNELHVRPKDEKYLVKFDVTRDARLQAGSLFAVQDRLRRDSVTPAEYIDVRVPEKAFYK